MISAESTDVMVSGITGKLGPVVAKVIQEDKRYNVIPYSIGRETRVHDLLGRRFQIITADDFEKDPRGVAEGGFVVVDASNLSQLDSAYIFAANGIPTLQLGTVGYKTKEVENGLEHLVKVNRGRRFHLLRCMNAAIPVISFINNLKGIGEVNPYAFRGCKAHVAESHQASKKSVPATAIKMKEALEFAGAEVDEIESIRDPKVQMEEWGVPAEFLTGHGYHRVTLSGEDQSLSWDIRVNGRIPYAVGVRDLVLPKLIYMASNTRLVLDEYR